MPKNTDLVATQPDSKKSKQIRDLATDDYRGGPISTRPVHATETVEVSPAYRRADGSRHWKGD